MKIIYYIILLQQSKYKVLYSLYVIVIDVETLLLTYFL